MPRAVGIVGAVLVAIGASCRIEHPRTPAPVTYFVAEDGDDRWTGTLPAPNKDHTDGPFATLDRARDTIRSRAHALPPGGITVELRAGRYHLAHPLELRTEDSGTAAAPIVYRGYPGERVFIDGAVPIEQFEPVTDPDTLARLAPEARGRVVRADLRASGVTELGSPAGNGVELTVDGRVMPIARWPNEGFVRIASVADPKAGVFAYSGTRPEGWVGEPEVWLHGYWYWDWSDERTRVASIDPAHHTIALAPPHHSYGYRTGQWFYAYNVLRELDRPGEWYIDRRAGTLYLWPTSTATVLASVASGLIVMRDVRHVELRDLTFEAVRDTAIEIHGGDHDRIDACVIRGAGGWGVRVVGGSDHAVVGCEITDTGEGGISLAGGDRATLTAARHIARNNHIHGYSRWKRTYQAGIEVSGVGQQVSHNLIDDAPHEAIALSGNDHVIELNEIHDVCLESNDAGAIEAGRDWTMRGTVIRYNYLHHIIGFEGRGCDGVMLDDMYSGTVITGNVFENVTRAVLIGGGRDNAVTNNVFISCPAAIHVDARGQSWAAPAVASSMKERLTAVPYRESPWRDRYPALARILEENPGAPSGNEIARNVSWHSGWTDIDAPARPVLDLSRNLTTGDPGFVDLAHHDLRLLPGSPARALGFTPIPIAEIGLER